MRDCKDSGLVLELCIVVTSGNDNDNQIDGGINDGGVVMVVIMVVMMVIMVLMVVIMVVMVMVVIMMVMVVIMVVVMVIMVMVVVMEVVMVMMIARNLTPHCL